MRRLTRTLGLVVAVASATVACASIVGFPDLPKELDGGGEGGDAVSHDSGKDGRTGDAARPDATSNHDTGTEASMPPLDGGRPDAEAGGFACDAGLTACSGSCVNLATDSANCGACGLSCANCSSGECLVTLASAQLMPTEIAVDSTFVYWVVDIASQPAEARAIYRIPLAGGTPVSLASGTYISALVAREGTLYVGGGILSNSNGLNGYAVAVPNDGGLPVTIDPQGRNKFVAGLAVNAKRVYWVDGYGGRLMSAPLDGGGVDGAAVTTLTTFPDGGAAGGSGQALVLQSSQIYVVLNRLNGSAAVTVPLDGGTPVVVQNIIGPRAIAASDAGICWTNADDGGPMGTVMCAPPSLTPVATCATQQSVPVSPVIDGPNVYWGNQNDGTIVRASRSGGPATTLATGQGAISYLVVGSTSVYWTNGAPDGGVMKLTPK
jgi:hypothetical protein